MHLLRSRKGSKQSIGCCGRIHGIGAFQQPFHGFLPIKQPYFHTAALIPFDLRNMKQIQLIQQRGRRKLFGKYQSYGVVGFAKGKAAQARHNHSPYREDLLSCKPVEHTAAGGTVKLHQCVCGSLFWGNSCLHGSFFSVAQQQIQPTEAFAKFLLLCRFFHDITTFHLNMGEQVTQGWACAHGNALSAAFIKGQVWGETCTFFSLSHKIRQNTQTGDF